MDNGEDIGIEEVEQQANTAGSAEEPRFLKVENLTGGFVTLLHPSLEDKRHQTIGPRRFRLLSKEFQDVGDNQHLVDLGIIKWELADSMGESDGREEALGERHALKERALEYLAQQVLLFPADDLNMRQGPGIKPRPGGPPDIPAMAYVIWELIFTNAMKEDGVMNVEYLKTTHLPFLQNVLMREKIWRNRDAIVEVLEQRIEELRTMDASGVIAGVTGDTIRY